ncbi:MAG: hypothetical protein Q7S82_01025 [bacterium]|nr:hypothetical protein [bacterium]
MIKNKNGLILIFILFILVLSRIALYPIFGVGIVGTDAEATYLPQVDELSQSLGSIFSQIGPAYSLFLLFFKKITNDVVAGPVFIQHIIGVITGVLVFYYFKRVNLFLAAFITIFVYSGWLALWSEHTILRESLAAFFLVSLILISSLAIREEKYFKLPYAFLAGFTGLILVFFRIEFIILVFLMPLIILVAKKKERPDFKIVDEALSSSSPFANARVADEGVASSSPFANARVADEGVASSSPFANARVFDGSYLKWSLGYFIPLLIVLAVYGGILPKQNNETKYGSWFGIAYLSVAYNGFMPKIFYYENSRYPELLKGYQESLREADKFTTENKREKVSRSISALRAVTENYLFEHSEINLSVNQLMDRVYLEIMTKNTLVYLESFVINLKNHLLGISELNTVLSKDSQITLLKVHLSGNEPSDAKDLRPVSIFDKAFRIYIEGMIIFSKILFWLFLVSLPFLFFRWKTLPIEIIISFLVVAIHISVLAIIADPAHRFRYAIDPFLYFFQLYLILIFFRWVFSELKNIKILGIKQS